jgi:hypothetical protein
MDPRKLSLQNSIPGGLQGTERTIGINAVSPNMSTRAGKMPRVLIICGGQDMEVNGQQLARDLDTYKDLEGFTYSLPTQRTVEKDTKNFLILMNSKLEFLKRAADATDSTHYAWIDFSIFHVIKEGLETSAYLKMLAATPLQNTCLLIPGCVDKYLPPFTKISWRFCGDLFSVIKNHFETCTHRFSKSFALLYILWGSHGK